MNLDLAGKTVIVTGGGSNIGRSIVFGFVNEGANVVIADWDEEQAKKVVKEAKGLPGKCKQIKTDVTSWDQVEQMVNETLAGYQKVDVLVNNVGWNYDKLFMARPREEWDKLININYRGVLNCTMAVLTSMTERKSGNIVSLGSDAGRMGEYGEAVYAGCKAGVMAFSKAVAREVGRYNIRLNVVCPGMTPGKPDEVGEKSLWALPEIAGRLTPDALEKAAHRYPLRRLGRPEDLSRAVLFLASDACAGFITGQTLSVSGGYTMT